MKQKQSISSPKKGMNLDSDISQLSNTEYTFALNANTVNEAGGNFNIQNEPSNQFAVRFPIGYKVLGFKNDILTNRTYYFLTNPTTKKSSIGYVENDIIEVFNKDLQQECPQCEYTNVLGNPFENIVQVPTLQYIELINDVCHIDAGREGLNFDINFPSKKIEIKQEKLETKLYWNDNRNGKRHLNVSNIESNPTSHYLITQEVPCGDDIIVNCILVDKLLVFPKHNKIQIVPELIQVGGNLKMGTYSFYVTYCDLLGNEITNYSTPTNPIAIFDENNNINGQVGRDAFTNYSIKLKVKNLDSKNFKYYKVVCVERANVDNTESAFVEGIHSTTDDTIVYTHSGSTSDDNIVRGNVSIKRRIDFNTLKLVKPHYDKAESTMVSGRRLWSKGLTKREEINLQPVVNLFGALAFDWQSTIAHKDLYKGAVANSLYKYYNREEVQPLAIRFYFKDGDYTANFPIIGRPPTTNDLQVVTGVNVESVNLTNDNCITINRNKRWQIEDTATRYSGFCTTPETGVIVTEMEVKTCDVLAVNTVQKGSITIEIDQKFRDLKTYIEDNYDEVTNPVSTLWIPSISPSLLNTYPLSHCAPNFDLVQCQTPQLDSQKNSIGIIDLKIPKEQGLEIGSRYIINTLVSGDNFTNVGYIKTGEYFTAVVATPTTWTTTEVFIEGKTLIESIFPMDYQDTIVKQSCTVYLFGNDGGVIVDERTKEKLLYNTDGSYADNSCYTKSLPCGQVLVKRDFTFLNLTPNTAEDIQTLATVSGGNYTQSYFNDWLLSSDMDDLIDLVSTKTANPIATGWQNKLHKKTMWFKTNATQDKFIFEVTPQKVVAPIRDSSSDGQTVRVSLYQTKIATIPFYTFLSDLTQGTKLLFEKTLTGFTIKNESIIPITPFIVNITNGNFYVAIDCKITTKNKATVCTLATPGKGSSVTSCSNASETEYLLTATDGCYSVITRDVEYKLAKINWQSLQINKTETYSSVCRFNIPKVTECEPKAYQKGKFAYWESTETYPDNNQLYNSVGIKIKPSDLSQLSINKKQDFEDYYKQSVDVNGNYTYKINTLDPTKSAVDFTCQPIRHPKFPSQNLTPYLYSGVGVQKFSETPIFPLGITVDAKVIKTMLQVAKNNGYLSQKDLENIDSYEILKGDNTIHKSVICSGMVFDMYNYTKKDGEKFWYANAPFNDLGADKFHTSDEARQNLIQHPFNSQSNFLYSFISPDLLLTKIQIPTEAVVTGYQYGNAIQNVVQQQEFPKYTILGEDARDLAETLAIAEVVLESIIKVGELTAAQVFGFSNSLGLVGAAIAAVGYAAQGLAKVGQYRYEWLKTFRDLGATHNFAHFTAGVATYNKFKTTSNRELRGLTIRKQLRDGLFNYVDKATGKRVNINNDQREDSALISFGDFMNEVGINKDKFNLVYPNEYISFDNGNVNSKSSKIIASNVGCENGTSSIRDVASPIITLKNYIPDQWGTIDSVNWLTTNYMFKIDEDTNCKPIFGGTVVISPFTYRRKLKLFRENAMFQPDKSPFDYSKSSNIGFTRFYVDYETSADPKRFGIFSFPDIVNDYNFDCETGRNDFYVKTPSKFYTHTHGVVDFLVESEINCHFRYKGNDAMDWFYRQGDNLSEKLQEKNLPIARRESFYYNNVYSFQVSDSPFKFLDYTYDKEVWKKRGFQPNACIYSEMDNNENDLTDPWLVYKMSNWYEFDKKYGKLINLKDIESYQFMAMFENGRMLHNAIDTISDKLTQQNQATGIAGIFAQRPIEFKMTDLGFEGTQHSDICSTPYGHFWVDAKRGRILQVDNSGKDVQIISEQAGNQQSNTKQWFREHLPLKIIKQLPNIDVDNKFKGIGFNIWYDDRNSRIFFTKRDYILKDGILPSDFIFDKETLKLKYKGTEVYFDNVTLFEDVSWTMNYNPTMGNWGSYFSFYPDYSPFNNNYFQVGYNWGQDKGTLWNHTMNNSSFQVFQNRLNPFIIEYPNANENANKMLNSIALTIEAKRYQSQWDTAIWKGVGFNKLTIWNDTNNSGILNLIEQKNVAQARKYPITNANGTQDIMFTPINGKHNINYFFNRAINQDNNIPMWIRDKNNIFKTLNTKAVSFTGKRTNERIKGETTLIRLTNDKESRFSIALKNSINDETLI